MTHNISTKPPEEPHPAQSGEGSTMHVCRSIKRWFTNSIIRKILYVGFICSSLIVLLKDSISSSGISEDNEVDDNYKFVTVYKHGLGDSVKRMVHVIPANKNHNDTRHIVIANTPNSAINRTTPDVNTKKTLDSSFKHLPIKYYVGVLSAEKYLDTRATDAYNTWAREVPNLQFYIGDTNKTASTTLPFVKLRDVDDRIYPPQKKGFCLLQYWCDNLIDKYDWFIKVDDDTYIKTALLERFLWTLNKTEKYYIGRPAYGIKEELESLGLQGNTFCSGQTVIYSKPLLQELCPHIQKCIQNVTSKHEDTELARCVLFNTGMQCAISRKSPGLHVLFHTTYEEDYFFGNLTGNKIFESAITVHAVKDSTLLFNIHYYYKKWLSYYNKEISKLPLQQSNPLAVEQLSGNVGIKNKKRKPAVSVDKVAGHLHMLNTSHDRTV